jgi:16S rRNA (cytidine1402-2'-O)-methyltransferase
MNSGILYLIATPIGNLEDITLRALKILNKVDFVACEDTRQTKILLQHYNIRAELLSYYGAREKAKARELMGHLSANRDIALVSDAGMPGISDPGSIIVREAIRGGITVIPIPGPSAGVVALAASGLPTDRFVFEGFLPRKQTERKKRLAALSQERRTIIFYESPKRIKDALHDMRTVMGERRAVIVRELTKAHEEFVRGTVSHIIERIGEGNVRGEIVIIVEGSKEEIDWERVDIPAYVGAVQERMGLDRMSALKLVAYLSGMPKSALYKRSLKSKV